MKILTVQLGYLDKVGAVITGDSLPIYLDNHPDKRIGTCRVFTNEAGQRLGELELDGDVDENLFFYYTSLNAADGEFWFSGLSLATKLYRDRAATTLKQMII